MEYLETEGILRSTVIGRARILIVDAKPMLDYSVALLEKDPYAFVDKGKRSPGA